MSKVKVKGSFGGKAKLVQIERGEMSIASIEQAFKEKFSLGNVQLKYNMSTGTVQGLYQDFHLEKALEDSTTSGAKYLEVEITGSSAPAAASTPAPAATSSPKASAPAVAPKASAPIKNTATPSSPSPSNRRLQEALGPESTPQPSAPAATPSAGAKFCSNCGAKNPGKFCAECGTPAAAGSAPSPSPSASKNSSVPASPLSPSKAPAAKPVGGNGCAACGGNIGLTSVSAMGTNWHKECFVCQTCKKSLLDCGFKGVNNLPMCGDCYSNQYGLKCSACKKVIDSEYVQVSGQPFHRECYA